MGETGLYNYLIFCLHTGPVCKNQQENPPFSCCMDETQLKLHTEVAFSPLEDHNVDVDDYKGELVTCLSKAWEAAKRKVERSQQKQKKPEIQDSELVIVCSSCMFHQRWQGKPTNFPSHIEVHT